MSAAKDNADVTPLFVEFRPGMRKRVSAAVEALIDVTDQIAAAARDVSAYLERKRWRG